MKHTRAVEILDQAKIAYELRSFEASEFTAEECAVKLGLPLESVYKTLLVHGEKSGLAMAVVPADKELSLKKLAHALSEKRMEMAPVEDLPRLTGYLKGGVSPLGGKKAYPVYLDEAALKQAAISISAGLRGLQIILAPAALISLTKAKLLTLTE